MSKLRRKLDGRTRAFRQNSITRLITGTTPQSRRRARPFPLNANQELFCRWNADRLGISLEDSRKRYFYSWNILSGGHRGARYNAFMFMYQEIFSVLYGNGRDELFDTYRFLGPRDILRWTAREPEVWNPGHVITPALMEKDEVSIVDFGAGLAGESRALADYLTAQGKKVHLFCADIPTLAGEFLQWLADQVEYSMDYAACTPEQPIPDLPECDVLFAKEFFEHVEDPLHYFDRFDAKLRPGGYLIGDISDHSEGLLHVTPRLQHLRDEVARRGYGRVRGDVICRKPV